MGLFFFGGLWLTVRKVPRSRRPLVGMAVSFFIRGVLLGFCFYALARHGGWIAVLAGLVGVLGVRTALMRRLSVNGNGETPGWRQTP
jgi:F1F0 ATPase subunit 2